MNSPENSKNTAALAEIENTDSESPETKELREAVFESLIEVASKINEGANGIICTIDTSCIAPELLEVLMITDPENKDKVLKMLKIYKPGTGAKEFAAQEKIYDLVAGKANTAQIPRPWACETFEIKSEKAKTLLSKLGFDAEQPNVDVILMDLVVGEELAAAFYRNIIKNDESWIAKNSYVDLVNIADTNRLHKMASELLKFEDPRQVKATNELERKQKEQAVMNRNAEKLYKRLHKNGFHIDQNTLDKTNNFLEYIHQAGWIHGDLHERNIMISPSGDPIILDFGFSRKVTDREEEKARLDSYGGEGEDLVLQDGYIIRRLRSLLETEVIKADPYTETFGEKLTQRLTTKEQDTLRNSISTVIKDAASWKNYSEALDKISVAARQVSGALFYQASLENPQLAEQLSKVFTAFEEKQYRNRKLMLQKKLKLKEGEYLHLKQAINLIKKLG
jgi:serine/threonine protein kinase